MGIFESVLSAIVHIMLIPIDLYGFPVTIWGVTVFSLAGGVIFVLIGRLLNGDD